MKTVLADKLAASGATMTEFGGAETAAHFGAPIAEFQALREGCGVYDLGWRAKISATGEDRVRWFNGMVTNNVKDLAPGEGNYNFLLNAQGRIQGDMFLYQRGESVLLDTDRGQAENILKVLNHFIIMDDVELTDISDKLTAIGFAGEKTEEILRAAGLVGLPAAVMRIEGRVWKEQKAYIVQKASGSGRAPSAELWVPPNAATEVWDALVAAGATPAGTEALEMARVLAGTPRYGQDIHEKTLPQETGQEQALHHTKGCYIGQEIVERIRARGLVHRVLTGFVLDGPMERGAKIVAQEKEVGEVTSVAGVPAAGRVKLLALGTMRREAGGPGTKVNIGGTTATVATLPFQI